MSAYKKSSNPFEDDDDDDYSFKKSAAQQNSYNDETDRRQRIQMHIDESESRQLDSTRRALASIYESEDVGIATAEELVRQGEQLNNIEKKTDEINKTLTTSQKHLNNIKSVFGGIKNWWGGGKDNSKLPPSKSEAPASPLKKQLEEQKDWQESAAPRREGRSVLRLDDDEDELNDRFMAGAQYSGIKPQREQMVTRITNSAQEDEMDDNLGLMCDGMSRLKGLAMNLGSEIDRQNDQLDRIDVSTDRALPRIENQNKQMGRILHK